MFFIIQQETIGRDPVQNAIIMDVINHNRYSHSYELMSSMDFYKEFNDEETFSMQMIRKTPEDFDERFQN
ncbi:MAG: hypothetical protein UHS47_04770, partial [Oscillospiraceae bacterium]|nr:hypothetical protein [Oscillospiraceae bacterium]